MLLFHRRGFDSEGHESNPNKMKMGLDGFVWWVFLGQPLGHPLVRPSAPTLHQPPSPLPPPARRPFVPQAVLALWGSGGAEGLIDGNRLRAPLRPRKISNILSGNIDILKKTELEFEF